MVRCPQCEIPMNEVTARANPGSLIQLDQCAQCGGIWCDKWELFPIHPDETAKLEPVDEEQLRSPQPLEKKTLYCPRCTAKLATPKDPFLGPDIQLDRCPKCDGIWLNRGQFTRFKRHQKKVRGDKMGPEAAFGKLEEAYQNPKLWVVTGTRGMFAYPQGIDESKEVVDNTLSGAVKLVLQTLVRMVLGV